MDTNILAHHKYVFMWFVQSWYHCLQDESPLLLIQNKYWRLILKSDESLLMQGTEYHAWWWLVDTSRQSISSHGSSPIHIGYPTSHKLTNNKKNSWVTLVNWHIDYQWNIPQQAGIIKWITLSLYTQWEIPMASWSWIMASGCVTEKYSGTFLDMTSFFRNPASLLGVELWW